MIPVSPQAASLLNLFPSPNVIGNPQYNYQTAIINAQHQDALIPMLTQDHRTEGHDFRSLRISEFAVECAEPVRICGYHRCVGAEPERVPGATDSVHGWDSHLTFGFSRQATQVFANFENVTNISGAAGITGNNQDPVNWGPPALGFSTLIDLSDGQSSHNRNQTASVGYSILWSHRNHSVTFGGDFRRQEFNKLSQQDARGTFTFTGAATSESVGGVLTAAPILPIFFWEFRTRVQLRSATRINIFGSLFTTRTWMTTGE